MCAQHLFRGVDSLCPKRFQNGCWCKGEGDGNESCKPIYDVNPHKLNTNSLISHISRGGQTAVWWFSSPNCDQTEGLRFSDLPNHRQTANHQNRNQTEPRFARFGRFGCGFGVKAAIAMAGEAAAVNVRAVESGDDGGGVSEREVTAARSEAQARSKSGGL
ncbi:hypothetical protein Syun_029178 [Stephania yunnanensis]|uniref:Uncharacterized protein n=1 Tax=Stephania yunnanensis TaxID=152371 RepID=A0AAP0ED47_9MAGN